MPHATVSNKKTLDKNDIAPGNSLDPRPLPNPRLAEIVGSLNLDFFQLPAKTVLP